jgi:hypothetical protein
MSDAYKCAVAYRDSIMAHHRVLCGEDAGDGWTWQEQAMRLSHELERYSRFLQDVVGGGWKGPIVFPSWEESEESIE